MKRNKLFRALLCLMTALFAMCIVFSSCSETPPDDAGNTPGDPSTPQTPADPADPETPAEPEPDRVTVTLQYHNGETDGKLVTEKGQTVTKPSDPVFGNHIFLGWYSAGEVYDWTVPVTADCTVQALWEKVYGGTLTQVYGSFQADGNDFYAQSAGIMANETEGFDRGTVEVSVTSATKTDSGIIVGLTGNGAGYYWESDVSYYFFFINIEGLAYLGKVDHGKWTALKTLPIENYELGRTYRLKTILDGTDLYCYIDDELYLVFSERNFLTGTGYGIRAGGSGVNFTDFAVTGKCKY